ncbi:MAG: hypothetical protein MUF36_03095 [Bacteroidales bacterium]|jgi:hypothetical protein|nr:hypothetical protein [Bacteroidales bacterium]
MKNRITTEDDLPELKKEDLKAAAERRENYARARDLQAEEFNVAIERRLEKDKQDRKA